MAKSTPIPSATSSLVVPAIFGLLLLLLLLSPPCTADNILYTPESLLPGQALTYGNYKFIMQTDCNLVLYDNGRAIWASHTNGKGLNCHVTMQRDGNLVVYSNNNAVWASNTQSNDGNYVCILQRDRNVVIYGGSRWATGTNNVGAGVTIVSSDVGGLAKNQTSTSSSSSAAVVHSNTTNVGEELIGGRKIAMVTAKV